MKEIIERNTYIKEKLGLSIFLSNFNNPRKFLEPPMWYGLRSNTYEKAIITLRLREVIKGIKI